MRNVWEIYKRDIKNIIKNPIALVIIIGLCILPSLYAWFNIYASWDPYGNTKGVKVAVVNNDEGGELEGRAINIGNDIVSELKNNKDIGWIFVDGDTAEYGLTHNKYYALIEIPKDFSKKITTIITKNPVKPQLIYRVNEKSNAIAPKITSAGAKALLKSVTATFVDKVNGVIFNAFNTLGEGIDVNKDKILELRNIIYKLNDGLQNIDTTMEDAEAGVISFKSFTNNINANLPVIEETLAKALKVAGGMEELVSTAQGDFNKSIELMEIRLKDIEILVGKFNDIISSYIENREDTSTLAAILEKAVAYLNEVNSKTDSIIQFLKILNLNNGALDNTINSFLALQEKISSLQSNLQEASNALNSGHEINSALLNSIASAGKEIENGIQERLNNFDSYIKPAINQISQGIVQVGGNVEKLLQEAEKQIPTIKEILNKALSTSEIGLNFIDEFKGKLPAIKSGIENLTIKLKEVISDDNINEIISILTNNADIMANFISTPVDLVEETVFHIPNYGSAMSPFYSVLSIWVGVLLLSSIISTEVKPLHKGEKIKSWQGYFGRLGLFLTLSIVQSFIIAVGDKYLLGVYMSNVPLFIAFSLFTAIVFTLIIYTLVSLLGNVGKAFGIILLVLQVAGSGGTFPIEVTPKFFQTIQPILPFTYSIGALREAVGGVNWNSIYKDVLILSSFGVIFLIVGLTLKGFLQEPMEKLQEKFKKSGISE